MKCFVLVFRQLHVLWGILLSFTTMFLVSMGSSHSSLLPGCTPSPSEAGTATFPGKKYKLLLLQLHIGCERHFQHFELPSCTFTFTGQFLHSFCYFCKMSYWFIPERQQGNPATHFAACAWTEWKGAGTNHHQTLKEDGVWLVPDHGSVIHAVSHRLTPWPQLTLATQWGNWHVNCCWGTGIF